MNRNRYGCHTPDLEDYGAEPFIVNIDCFTKQNPYYRTTLWTGNHLQVTPEIIGVQAENIIVIMNESFSDFRVIRDFDVLDECMPYVDAMKENVIKGNLYVPVLGGGTANTEFVRSRIRW